MLAYANRRNFQIAGLKRAELLTMSFLKGITAPC